MVNCPAVFQRAVDHVFKGLNFVKLYLEDVLIVRKTEIEHFNHIKIVFERLKQYNIKLRLDKCKFFQKELKYLGHIINKDGIKPDTKYIDKVIKLKEPTTKKEVERFLGMVQWLGKFIPNLSKYTEPISKLKRKDVKFIWNDKTQQAFNKIKNAVKLAKGLKYPNFDETFYVITDASDYAIGAVLMQLDSKKKLVPIEFMSKQLDTHQRNWHCSEKEVYAILFALEKWKQYLLRKKFIIYTDHRNLVELIKVPKYNSKLNRWLLRLQPFHFEARWIAGCNNIPADYLSRDISKHPAYRDYRH